MNHRVKSITMSTFTSEEITILKNRGNLKARKIWLAKYDENKFKKPKAGDSVEMRSYMSKIFERDFLIADFFYRK